MTEVKVTPAAYSGVNLQGTYAATQAFLFHWKDLGEHYLGSHALHSL